MSMAARATSWASRSVSLLPQAIVLYSCGVYEKEPCRVFEELSTQFRSIKFLKFKLEGVSVSKYRMDSVRKLPCLPSAVCICI